GWGWGRGWTGRFTGGRGRRRSGTGWLGSPLGGPGGLWALSALFSSRRSRPPSVGHHVDRGRVPTDHGLFAHVVGLDVGPVLLFHLQRVVEAHLDVVEVGVAVVHAPDHLASQRSEERRVGKGCGSERS